MSMQSFSKKKLVQEVKGSNVGYNDEEIRSAPTRELLSIQSSIKDYYQSKRQKKRNIKYKSLYVRIQKELEDRRSHSIKEVDSFTLKHDFACKPSSFLNKKRFNETKFNVPEFFNDYSTFAKKSLKESVLSLEIIAIAKEEKDPEDLFINFLSTDSVDSSFSNTLFNNYEFGTETQSLDHENFFYDHHDK